RRVVDGCGFRFLPDISLDRVQLFLSGQCTGVVPTGPLDPEKESFTRAELATLLGIKRASVNPLVRRHGLEAVGHGKARRFPRSTAEVLLTRTATGIGASTAGYYAREIKAFTRWLAKRKRIPDDPLTELQGATALSDHRHDRRPLTLPELRKLLATTISS